MSFDAFSNDGDDLTRSNSHPFGDDHNGGSYTGYDPRQASQRYDGAFGDGIVDEDYVAVGGGDQTPFGFDAGVTVEHETVDDGGEIYGFGSGSANPSYGQFESVPVSNGNGQAYDLGEDDPVLPPPSEMQEEGYALREWRRLNANGLTEKERIEKEMRSGKRVEEEEDTEEDPEEEEFEEDPEEEEEFADDAPVTDVYPLSSETKDAETLTPLSTIGTEMAMYENSGLVITQEGGVEDMELDSEENIVHGSDVDGTVVDSVPVPVPKNIAVNTHQEVSFTPDTDALSNMTVVAESLNSSTAQRGETTLNHELKVEDGGKYMNLDLKDHAVPKASRMVATSRNKRSSSFSTQLMDTNKRPAIICDYYAKGWCIKGNSCRFLHVKEDKNYTNKQPERGLASANGEKHVGEGAGYDTKSIYQEPHAESHTRQLHVEFNYSSHEPRFLHFVKPEFSRGLVASSSAFVGRFGPSSNVTESIDYRGNQHLFNDPLQSIADRYIKQHLPPPSTTGKFSSRQISTADGSSNSAISLSSNPFDGQKILSGGMDFNASSVSLGSRPLRDLSNSIELTLKVEMYKWEPSRPFRPSYYISIPHMSSPGSMYDPLRDGIEQASLGVGSFKAELIHYPSHQRYPDFASEGIHFDMDKYNGAVLDKNGHSHVTGLQVAEAEVAESSVADQCNRGIAHEGDNMSGTSRRKEISETNKTNTSSAGKKNKRNKEKIHQSKQVDADRGFDEAEQREPKTSKQFRAALVEFIKELLKPAWRDGNLSKDAHNLVVKKAVEKVLSSLHSHQVPSTPELVQQYLSSSKAKITKLVEAYVQKHNKT
uniref:C3H1-type domain-containing protein n=1 Tax=Kalanchoe fedtschenkoi TaxID=63787 RepID=A0A7N0RDF2_KALFE